MSYYCTECEKDHKEGYKAHWKYKELVVVPDPDFVAFMALDEKITEITEKVESLENKLDTIVVILKAWKVYIDRKHPYARNYHQFFLILDGL